MNTRLHRSRLSLAAPRRQRGVALFVALILLVLTTLIAVASSRSTLLQERMSGNMYDRTIALQRAESALRAAEAAITTDWLITNLGGVDCTLATNIETANCLSVPPATFTGTNANWITVPSAYQVNSASAPGQPQYFIQLVFKGKAAADLGLDANADFANYGNNYASDDAMFYRVTARSSTPTAAGDRSIVVLQSTVRRIY
jgi:type IV pilus assembly protein PilX